MVDVWIHVRYELAVKVVLMPTNYTNESQQVEFYR